MDSGVILLSKFKFKELQMLVTQARNSNYQCWNSKLHSSHERGSGD
ncbi:hypothetical protein SOVF_155750 [Spinacia oleracea]|nr:hypothetical protein SOVF_155750 [Spinacia oleracea]